MLTRLKRRIAQYLPSEDRRRAGLWKNIGPVHEGSRDPNKVGYALAPGGRGQQPSINPYD